LPWAYNSSGFEGKTCQPGQHLPKRTERGMKQHKGWPVADADIPPIHMTQQINQEQDASSNLNQGPLTISHAKKLQQHVTSHLAEFDNNITEDIILPKSSTLMIIRFKHQGYKGLQEVEEAYTWIIQRKLC
jgi:hypothetical protein